MSKEEAADQRYRWICKLDGLDDDRIDAIFIQAVLDVWMSETSRPAPILDKHLQPSLQSILVRATETNNTDDRVEPDPVSLTTLVEIVDELIGLGWMEVASKVCDTALDLSNTPEMDESTPVQILALRAFQALLLIVTKARFHKPLSELQYILRIVFDQCSAEQVGHEPCLANVCIAYAYRLGFGCAQFFNASHTCDRSTRGLYAQYLDLLWDRLVSVTTPRDPDVVKLKFRVAGCGLFLVNDVRKSKFFPHIKELSDDLEIPLLLKPLPGCRIRGYQTASCRDLFDQYCAIDHPLGMFASCLGDWIDIYQFPESAEISPLAHTQWIATMLRFYTAHGRPRDVLSTCEMFRAHAPDDRCRWTISRIHRFVAHVSGNFLEAIERDIMDFHSTRIQLASGDRIATEGQRLLRILEATDCDDDRATIEVIIRELVSVILEGDKGFIFYPRPTEENNWSSEPLSEDQLPTTSDAVISDRHGELSFLWSWIKAYLVDNSRWQQRCDAAIQSIRDCPPDARTQLDALLRLVDILKGTCAMSGIAPNVALVRQFGWAVYHTSRELWARMSSSTRKQEQARYEALLWRAISCAIAPLAYFDTGTILYATGRSRLSLLHRSDHESVQTQFVSPDTTDIGPYMLYFQRPTGIGAPDCLGGHTQELLAATSEPTRSQLSIGSVEPVPSMRDTDLSTILRTDRPDVNLRDNAISAMRILEGENKILALRGQCLNDKSARQHLMTYLAARHMSAWFFSEDEELVARCRQQALALYCRVEEELEDVRRGLRVLPGNKGLASRQLLSGRYDRERMYMDVLALLVEGVCDNRYQETRVELLVEVMWDWVQKSKARTICDSLSPKYWPIDGSEDVLSMLDERSKSLWQRHLDLQQALRHDESLSLHHRLRLAELWHQHRRLMREWDDRLAFLLQEEEGTPVARHSLVHYNPLEHLDQGHSTGWNIVYVDWFEFTPDLIGLTALSARGHFLSRLELTIADVHHWCERFWATSTMREKTLEDTWSFSALQELNKLVAPLEDFSDPDDVLVLSPTGPLHLLPLHALSVDGVPLIERNPVVYTSSQTAFVASTQAATDPLPGHLQLSHTVISVYEKVAAGIAEENFSVRPQERMREAATHQYNGLIDSSAADTKAHLLWGAQATRARVMGALQQSSFVSYLGHADIDYETLDPLKQSLRLFDEPLTADDIHLLSLPRSVLLLQACSSSSQTVKPGDEPLGLVTAALLAGAVSVVGNLWPVRVEPAAAFSKQFVSAFAAASKSGQDFVDLARIYRQVVLRIRQVDGRPCTWASFVFHGSPIVPSLRCGESEQ